MNNKQLSKDLKNKAIKLGLCRQWQREWNTIDKNKLCEMYIEGLDFCIEYNYPTTAYMKENFEGVMQKHGIYVDEEVSIVNPGLRTYVINGNSNGTITLNNFDLCEVYVRGNSNITIETNSQSSVYISVFDKAVVNVIQNDRSRASIYKYGNNCNIKHIGNNVVIKEGKMG